MLCFITQFIFVFITLLIPLYASINAIETNDAERWLAYWIIYAIVLIAEHIFGIFLRLLPYYEFIKIIFLVWCILPTQNNGSIFAYNRIICPLFTKHRKFIDNVFDRTVRKTMSSFSHLFENGIPENGPHM